MRSCESPARRPLTILMADDDEDDRLLTAKALKSSRLINTVHFATDGHDLMQYLRSTGAYAPDGVEAPHPGLILLDLNMPKMDGREALAEIKGDPELRRIPVVVLTTSSAEEDIVRTYDLGVNSFISKPVTFEGLATVMQSLACYWFELVELRRNTTMAPTDLAEIAAVPDPLLVLLVEDDEDDHLLTKSVLAQIEGTRYVLHWARDYRSALESVQEHDYNVCLVDYRLGARDGIELVRELHDDDPDLPVIVMTGQGDRDVDVEAAQAGAADYLVKGEVTAALLERAIRYAMRVRADVRALRQSEAELRQAQRMDAVGQLAAAWLTTSTT